MGPVLCQSFWWKTVELHPIFPFFSDCFTASGWAENDPCSPFLFLPPFQCDCGWHDIKSWCKEGI